MRAGSPRPARGRLRTSRCHQAAMRLGRRDGFGDGSVEIGADIATSSGRLRHRTARAWIDQDVQKSTRKLATSTPIVVIIRKSACIKG